MEGIHTLPYVNLGGNLYRHKPIATLPIEAERLTHNRQLIAADPPAWTNPSGCLAVLDVLAADCFAAMLGQSALTAGGAS